jgi:hypothetical protein
MRCLLDDKHIIAGFSAPSSWWNSVGQWATWATDIDIRVEAVQPSASDFALWHECL